MATPADIATKEEEKDIAQAAPVGTSDPPTTTTAETSNADVIWDMDMDSSPHIVPIVLSSTNSPHDDGTDITSNNERPVGAQGKGKDVVEDAPTTNTSTPTTLAVNGNISEEIEDSDEQAEAMVVDSLRAQVQDLFSQVTQLNSKLVSSYDRVSDLEDDLHMSSANARSSALKIAQLELERTQHLSALNTGLLVERSAVTAELSRVMEKATDEAARAGKAENARVEIEQELDDLSAGLFNQANNMVAQARFAQASSERKVEEAEIALRAAEEAVSSMQAHVQALQAEKEQANAEAESIRMRMGKGKWIERNSVAPSSKEIQLLSSHSPYQEFLLFIAHLRSVRPATTHPPVMASLLQLPFLARLQNEDSDPTVRLDLAPSLNWLSRRSVLTAIHNGELTVEPMTAATLIEEVSTPNYSSASILAGGTSVQVHNISCALCGTAIFPAAPMSASSPRPPLHPAISRTSSTAAGWSSTLMKTVSGSTNATNHPGSSLSPPIPSSKNSDLYQERPYPTQVFIFRVISQPGTGGQATAVKAPYPLCTSGWCLTRLRAACSMWAFVRAALVERVWEEEVSTLHAPAPKRATSRDSGVGSLVASVLSGGTDKTTSERAVSPTSAAKPPLPVRKSKIGGFWGRASSTITAGIAQVSSITTGTTPEPQGAKQPPSTPPRPPRASITSTPITSPLNVNAKPASPAPTPPPRSANRESRAAVAQAPGVDLLPTPKEEAPIMITDATRTTSTSTITSAASPPFLTPVGDEVADPMQSAIVPKATTELITANDVFSDTPATPTMPTTPTVPAASTIPEPVLSAETYIPSSEPVPPAARTPPPPPAVSTPATPAPAPILPPRAAARTASPAPSGAATPGTPPPVPRRAAARVPRPISMVAQATTNSANATSETASPIAEEGAAASPVTMENATPAVPEAQSGVAPPPPSTQNGVPTEVEEAPKVAGEDSAVLEVKAVEAASAVEADPVKEENTAFKNETIAATDSSPSVPSESKASDEVTTPAPPPIADTPAPAPQVVTKDVEPNITEEPVSEYTEIYVGDATWEERAWKELTRLREDMFYARIGGIR